MIFTSNYVGQSQRTIKEAILRLGVKKWEFSRKVNMNRVEGKGRSEARKQNLRGFFNRETADRMQFFIII